MSFDRRSGWLTKLYVDPNGGSSFDPVEGVIETISGPGLTRDEADATVIDDIYEYPLPGVIRTGSITFDIVYDPNSDTNDTLEQLLEQNFPIPSWKIEFQQTELEATPTSRTFNGFVKALGSEVARNGVLKRSVEVRIVGAPGSVTPGSAS